MRKSFVWPAVALLLALFVAALAFSVHRQSLSWDEGDHLFAGYQSLRVGDFGLNPEHPPLVKEVAALPLLFMHLHTPALRPLKFFKDQAYYGGHDLIYGNGGLARADQIIFRARMAASVFSLLMALLVFLAGREMFGTAAGLFALVLIITEPNILAHGAYVTTDMGITCFLTATVYAFYRYMQRPSAARLVVLGLAAGLALAAKHSAVLLLPIAFALLAAELFLAPRSARIRTARTFVSGAVLATLVAVVLLWSTYGFRYSAHPAGAHMQPPLSQYMGPLAGHLEARCYLLINRLHLLPESYTFGLTDVRLVSTTWPSYLLGHIYENGVFSYFLLAFLIKSTAAFLLLSLLALLALALRVLPVDRRTLYLLLPVLVYVLFACLSGYNIGGRHILPIYPLLALLISGAVVALARRQRAWAVVAGVLLVWHIGSTARAYPNTIAYSNEFWGGPTQTYKYLTDSNMDWGQQLKSVKLYLDQNHIHDCWFAYFVSPLIDFHDYGIPCKLLPTPDQVFGNIQVDTPPTITGTVLISASDLTGYEYGSAILNPLRRFIAVEPVAQIDDGVFVYQGTFDTRAVSAFGHATRSVSLLKAGNAAQARSEAAQAVALDPTTFQAQVALGDASLALGDKAAAREAYTQALALAHRMEPSAQHVWLPQMEGKLKSAQ